MRPLEVADDGGLIAHLGGDDLPPHRAFPFRRPFDLAAEQFGVGGAVVGEIERAWLELLVAHQHQHVQLRHAPQRAGGDREIGRRRHDDGNIRQRDGALLARLAILNVKLVELHPYPQVVAEEMENVVAHLCLRNQGRALGRSTQVE